MKNKGTWILFLVVVLITAYAYFGEYKGKEKEKASQEAQAKIFKDLKMDQVNLIQLEKPNEKIVLSRSNEGWKVVEPITDGADSEGIESWLKQLAEEKTLTTAVEGPDIQWQFFGFDKNISKLTLTTTAGVASTVEISEKKNFENNTFIRYPQQNKVFVASSTWGGYAGKTIFDLRNKRVFRHQISNVQTVSVKNKKTAVVFENKEAKWINPSRPDWELDQNKVRESIAKLNEAQALEVLVESKDLQAQKAKYNFSQPDLTFNVKLADKVWSAWVVQTKDKHFIMKISEPELIVKVDNAFFDKFSSITPEAYRDTKLPFLTLDKTKVKAIDYETSLKKSSLIEKNGSWDLVKADQTVEVQQEKVQSLLDKLKELNALNYASDSELKKARLTQKVQLLDQEQKSVFELKMSESLKMKIDNMDKNVRVAKTNLYKEPFIIEDSEIEKLQLNELTKIKVSKSEKSEK